MWRSFFCAIGLSALVLGCEFLVIERATLSLPADPESQQSALFQSIHGATHTKDFVPPDWAPWTLLSFGAVVVLYASGVAKE
jgi:hypothetical protein